MEKIDIETWDRKNAFHFFSKFTNPYASVVSTVNVDNLVRYSKENNITFYGLMSFMVLKTINEIDEFKYVLSDNEVYKYEKINMTFSVLKENKKLNFSRTVEYNEFSKFIDDFTYAKYEAESDLPVPFTKENNKIYVTCVPFIRFSALENPINSEKIDSIPRICWGKYFVDFKGEYNIDLSIQVNHAFQDGYHIGMFYNLLQSNLLNFKGMENEKEYILRRPR